MPFHLIRLFGLTLAAVIVAMSLGLLALRLAAADEPDPWSTVQLVAADTLLRSAELFGAFAAWGGGLALILLLAVLVLALVHHRTSPPTELRSRPERTTGGRESV